jgi:transposase-like protein
MKGNNDLMRYFPAQTRHVLARVTEGRLKKTEAARKLQISRKTLYQWLRIYERSAGSANLGLEKSKKKYLKKELLKVLVANPRFGCQRLAEKLAKKGWRLSSKQVWLWLKKLELTTQGKRLAFSFNYQSLDQPGDKFFPGHLRQTPEARKRMVEEALLGGKSVSSVCREHHLSRKTFYKWKRRYEEARGKEAALLTALVDQNPKGLDHPRALPKETQAKILRLARKHPEYSTHQVARLLANVSNHGVQNFFSKANLNTYEKRLEKSRSLVKVLGNAFLGDWLRGFKQLFGNLPVISSLPPPALAPGKWLGQIKPFLTPFLLSFLTSLFFANFSALWVIQVSQVVSLTEKIGLILAAFSLMVGILFFTYSMKYYLTLALVLSFSRETAEREERENNLKSSFDQSGRSGFWNLLGRVFGVELIINNYRGSQADRNRQILGVDPDMSSVKLRRRPFISIQLPMYNEKRVVERLLAACTKINYRTLNKKAANFEIIVLDDSTDKTTAIARRELWRWRLRG